MSSNFYAYICQILTDFKNSFTVTLCGVWNISSDAIISSLALSCGFVILVRSVWNGCASFRAACGRFTQHIDQHNVRVCACVFLPNSLKTVVRNIHFVE